MTNNVPELLIPDLNEKSLAELSALLGNAIRPISNPQSEVGREVATLTAVVIVSLAALRVLAVWIARQTQYEEAEVSVQTKRRDGSVKTISFRSRSGSARSDSDVLKALAEACSVELSDLPADTKSLE